MGSEDTLGCPDTACRVDVQKPWYEQALPVGFVDSTRDTCYGSRIGGGDAGFHASDEQRAAEHVEIARKVRASADPGWSRSYVRSLVAAAISRAADHEPSDTEDSGRNAQPTRNTGGSNDRINRMNGYYEA